MTAKTELKEIVKTDDKAEIMESVLLGGDLSKLNPGQRVSYYQKVCESIGLNPLTKPFDYIQLNGKLTLYAKKDATDQLRNKHSVSIDDVAVDETETHFIVKVKGHDGNGRTDVEVGVVGKKDMQGNFGNAYMKAVTKAKRRLTLSLCGLGWLDETEIETIPDAKPVNVGENGEINNPDPITDKAWEYWTALVAQADGLKVKHGSPDRAKMTTGDLRQAYDELRSSVEAAQAQEESGG